MESLTAADLWRIGRYVEAKQHFEAALSILHGPHGMLSHELAVGYLIMAQVDFSMMLADGREYRAALPHAEEALLFARKEVAAQGERDPGWESVQSFAQVAIGRVLCRNGRSREGLPFMKAGLATLRALYLKDPSDAEAAGALARCDLWAVDAERAAHAYETARKLGREVIALSTAALRQDPDDASATRNMKDAWENLRPDQLATINVELCLFRKWQIMGPTQLAALGRDVRSRNQVIACAPG